MPTWLQVPFLLLWMALPVAIVSVPVADAWHHSAIYERVTERNRPRGRFGIAFDVLLLFTMHLPLFALAAALLWPALLLVGSSP